MANRQVNIPGIGPVNFPDTMSDAEVAAAARSLLEKSQGGPGAAQGPGTSFGQKVIDNATAPPSPENFANAQQVATQNGVPNPYRQQVAPQPVTQQPAADLPQFDAADLAGAPRQLTPRSQKLSDYTDPMWQDARDRVKTMGRMGAYGLMSGVDFATATMANAAKAAFAGWAGGLTSVFSGGNMDAAAKVTNGINNSFMFPPMTQGGREMAKSVASALEPVDNAAKEVAWHLGAHNPELATLAYTAMQAIPIERGFVAAGAARDAANATIKATKDLYNQKGITLGSAKMDQQMADFAKKQFADVPQQRGVALEPLIQDVQARSNNMQQLAQDAADAAQNTKGRILLKGFKDKVSDVVDKLNTDFAGPMLENDNVKWAMKQVSSIMSDTRKSLSFTELDSLRTKIKNLPGGSTGPLAVIHDGLDDFINTQIAKGFVTGDKNLTKNFNYAKDMRDKYAKQFKPGTEVYRMATDLSATPEEFSNYIFNLTDSGYKVQAVQTVRQVKEIFGAKSPQMDALRSEFLGKLVDPLRGEKPDFKAFMDLYDRSVRKNPNLVTEMAPAMQKDIEQLYRLAKASDKVGPPLRFNWEGIQKRLTAEAFGNGLAKNATKLQFLNNARRFLFGKNEKNVSAALVKELTGVDRAAPLFQPGSVQQQMLWAGAIKEQQQKDLY